MERAAPKCALRSPRHGPSVLRRSAGSCSWALQHAPIVGVRGAQGNEQAPEPLAYMAKVFLALVASGLILLIAAFVLVAFRF
jgi:hypothetical protein